MSGVVEDRKKGANIILGEPRQLPDGSWEVEAVLVSLEGKVLAKVTRPFVASKAKA